MAETALQRPLPPQDDPPLPPEQSLPTMYDLPSEDPEDPGLPDEFHIYQPQLLRECFRPPGYPPEQVFVATDLNLYYDVRHTLRHKRPDWFAVLGIDRLYRKKDLRLSYVIWQEGISPYIAVELLSPKAEREDLGKGPRDFSAPPSKWEVYEQLLRIPYYLVYSRRTRELQVYELSAGKYRLRELRDNRFWLEPIGIGIGLWEGRYQDIEGTWMRWYDQHGDWIPTPLEQAGRQAGQEAKRAEQEAQRAEREARLAARERQRADRLAAKLRSLGIDPEE